MPRNQTASHRAAGATSASPKAPKGDVRPVGSKSSARDELPQTASAASPAAHTSRRLVHVARHATRSAWTLWLDRRGRADASAGRRRSTTLRSRSMPAHGATQLLASWWSDNQQWVTALIALVITAVTVFLVDRAIARRMAAVAARLAGGALTPEADTRLRVLRRVIEVTIVVIGVAIAAAQFEALDKLVAPFLASSAIVAAVIGFASRQTLANAVAGVLLAVTQPLRIGDLVTFEGETGTVDDVRLTYTYLRNSAGARIVIPNERLAAGVLRNDTVLEPTVGTEVSLWLAPEADALRAIDVLQGALPEARATVAEVAVDGTRLALAGEPVVPSTKAQREADLRARAYGALRAAGLR